MNSHTRAHTRTKPRPYTHAHRLHNGNKLHTHKKKSRSQPHTTCVFLFVVAQALSEPALRDEAYAFMVKQTTMHPHFDRQANGWQLWSLCARFFTPSERFYPHVAAYLHLHVSMQTAAAKVCLERLTMTKHSGHMRTAVSLKEGMRAIKIIC